MNLLDFIDFASYHSLEIRIMSDEVLISVFYLSLCDSSLVLFCVRSICVVQHYVLYLLLNVFTICVAFNTL